MDDLNIRFSTTSMDADRPKKLGGRVMTGPVGDLKRRRRN
jgi:hypothetical protein